MQPLSFLWEIKFYTTFFFTTFVNTIGTFGSKSIENKGLISTREKIRMQRKKSVQIRT